MKKLVSLLIIIACLFTAFTGCQKEPPNTQTNAPEADTTAPPTLADLDVDPSKNTKPSETKPEVTEPPVPTYPVNEDGLPEYVPGTIKLLNQESDDFEFERKYRSLYYRIDSCYSGLLSQEQRDDFWEWSKKDDERTNYGEFMEEMWLVSMIKRYDIPREEMERAVEYAISMNIQLGQDMYWEECEVPNLDIIYTFDNEIINNFYRYE